MRCMNVRKDFFGRVEVCRAVEARISVQVEPLEEALEVGHDVPQPMLDEPVVLWKALSTSITLEWLFRIIIKIILDRQQRRRRRGKF